MSDSDDTEILLLIPPNYFISDAQENLQAQIARQHELQYEAADLLDATIYHMLEYDKSMKRVADGRSCSPTRPPPTASYQFLEPDKKEELNDINNRLHSLQLKPRAHQFTAPSDISTISNNSVLMHLGQKSPIPVHSTPKCVIMQRERGNNSKICEKPLENQNLENDILSEIDHFFEDRQTAEEKQLLDAGATSNNLLSKTEYWNPLSDNLCAPIERYEFRVDPQISSLPVNFNNCPSDTENLSHYPYQPITSKNNANPKYNGDLISLSAIWDKSGQNNVQGYGDNKSVIKEEQLRRQHLETIVHKLQSRLLEYQQRICVAIEVDRTKDAALTNSQHELKSLTTEVNKLRDINQQLEADKRGFDKRLDDLQHELIEAVSYTKKIQEKNERLESEMAEYSKKTNECNSMYKQQVEDLEVKLHACKKSEEFTNTELNKMKDKLAKAEYQNDKMRENCQAMEKEIATLRQQKEMLQDFHQKQKNRADSLESQRKSLQEALGSMTENEITLKKKFELQQKHLKTHYQQELENVVAQKLKEFQAQLDSTNESLRTEARARERLIAERAVKQLDLMNEKSELELKLLQEKHNAEIELYRIQLANASKKIEQQETELHCYKSRRADIAEKLHDVMETQWQKALEILTSPSSTRKIVANDTDENVSADAEAKQKEREISKTPKNSRRRRSINTRDSNQNVSEQQPQLDRLQAYIELLLSKSPRDIEKLDEVLALSYKPKTSHSNQSSMRDEKPHRRHSLSKPPWKA